MNKYTKKQLHNTDPPNQFPWVWIILGKLVTKATHHTNQDTTWKSDHHGHYEHFQPAGFVT